MTKYRVETGSVYEYDSEARAYIFVGKLNGGTLAQFIRDYENQL
jgi:hypothetical protein